MSAFDERLHTHNDQINLRSAANKKYALYSKESGRVLSLIKWTLCNKANLLIQRMLQLYEVVYQFKYYNANDIHFSKVVYTYKPFTINC